MRRGMQILPQLWRISYTVLANVFFFVRPMLRMMPEKEKRQWDTKFAVNNYLELENLLFNNIEFCSSANGFNLRYATIGTGVSPGARESVIGIRPYP